MTEENCPFCDPDPACIFYRGENVFGIWDAYPVSEGPSSSRPATSRAGSTPRAKNTPSSPPPCDDRTRGDPRETSPRRLQHRREHRRNRGTNGTAPTRPPHPPLQQDVQDPRGGVRHVIPSRANYLKPESSSAEKPADRVADAGPRSLQAPHDLPNRAPINIFVVFRARNSKSLTLRVKVEKSTKLSVRWNGSSKSKSNLT